MEKQKTAVSRSWTARGAVSEADKAVIRGMVEHNPVAARIFLTGEVHEDYIGQPAALLLYSINDAIDGSMKGHDGTYIEEPLFIQTKAMTVQMARFEPEAVWRCCGMDFIKKLHAEEEKRLDMEIRLDEPDFYQSLISTVKADCGEYIFPVVKQYGSLDTFYNIMYLAALILYGKPGYMAVPVSQHFALPETAGFLKNVEYRPLTKAEQKEVIELREKHSVVRGLTNPELNFLVGLYDRDKGR
jgi:hypothetical protein